MEQKSNDAHEDIHTFLLQSVPYLKSYYGIDEGIASNRQQLTSQFQLAFGCPHDAKQQPDDRNKGIRIAVTPVCKCGSTNAIELSSCGQVCTKCGLTESENGHIKDGKDGLTHVQRLNLPPHPYTYKPLSHFSDLLQSVQGFNTRRIAPDVVPRMQQLLKQYRIPEQSITPAMCRLLLQEMRESKYYEDIYFLCRILNKTYKPIVIPKERVTILKSCFREVFSRFARCARIVEPRRKNFLSYPYLAFKLCELLGWSDYSHCFTLLKSRAKLRIQDEILKMIFADLQWQWTDTV